MYVLHLAGQRESRMPMDGYNDQIASIIVRSTIEIASLIHASTAIRISLPLRLIDGIPREREYSTTKRHVLCVYTYIHEERIPVPGACKQKSARPASIV
jgi:hypothetical protein